MFRALKKSFLYPLRLLSPRLLDITVVVIGGLTLASEVLQTDRLPLRDGIILSSWLLDTILDLTIYAIGSSRKESPPVKLF